MYEKELNEKRNDLITRAEDVLNKAKAEKRELTEAEAAELAEIRDNVRRIVATLEIADDIGRAAGTEKTEAEANEGGNETMERSAEEIMKETEVREAKAFEDYIRDRVTEERANSMTKSDNGAVIPQTIANRIIRKVYDICPILERSTKYNVKGKLELPYYDESTTKITVDWASEFVDLASNVGELTSIELSGYLAGALVLISNSLINNAQFDIVGFVVDQMAYSIKRFIEKILLNGGGSVTALAGVTQSVTAAATGAITGDEIITLKDTVKDAFQENACWIMSPGTRTALRLLTDDVGRYLLQDDISAPFGNTLLGKPVFVSDNMDDIAAGKTVIYYGDMRCLATKWSEEMSIQVLREKYATQHATGVVGWLEFDAKVQDAQGIAKLVMHAA